jgi:hypothetical protein
MVVYTVFDQIADLLASLEPSKILALKPTDEAQNRFSELVALKHNGNLSEAEKDELDHFVVLERLMRLTKLRALKQAA